MSTLLPLPPLLSILSTRDVTEMKKLALEIKFVQNDLGMALKAYAAHLLCRSCSVDRLLDCSLCHAITTPSVMTNICHMVILPLPQGSSEFFFLFYFIKFILPTFTEILLYEEESKKYSLKLKTQIVTGF